MVNIPVRGTIVASEDAWIYDYFGIENVSPKGIEQALLDAKGDEVTLEVNSGGGDVFAANDIWYLLQKYSGKTCADITGLAASAATIVCCGAETVRGVPGMQYMIHNVSTSAYGDYNEMDHTSDILQNANRTISNVYRMRTGLSEKELLNLMNQETWMDATRALELHLIDEIIGDSGILTNIPITINDCFAKILSDETKNKLRASLKNPDEKPDFLVQKNQLNLLRMKGERRNEV